MEKKEDSNLIISQYVLAVKEIKNAWRHHVHIAYKCKSIEEAMFYIYQTIEQNISDNLYAKQGKVAEYQLQEIVDKTTIENSL